MTTYRRTRIAAVAFTLLLMAAVVINNILAFQAHHFAPFNIVVGILIDVVLFFIVLRLARPAKNKRKE